MEVRVHAGEVRVQKGALLSHSLMMKKKRKTETRYFSRSHGTAQRHTGLITTRGSRHGGARTKINRRDFSRSLGTAQRHTGLFTTRGTKHGGACTRKKIIKPYISGHKSDHHEGIKTCASTRNQDSPRGVPEREAQAGLITTRGSRPAVRGYYHGYAVPDHHEGIRRPTILVGIRFRRTVRSRYLLLLC